MGWSVETHLCEEHTSTQINNTLFWKTLSSNGQNLQMASYSLWKASVKDRDRFLEGMSWKCHEGALRTGNRVRSRALDKGQGPDSLLGSERSKKQRTLASPVGAGCGEPQAPKKAGGVAAGLTSGENTELLL